MAIISPDPALPHVYRMSPLRLVILEGVSLLLLAFPACFLMAGPKALGMAFILFLCVSPTLFILLFTAWYPRLIVSPEGLRVRGAIGYSSLLIPWSNIEARVDEGEQGRTDFARAVAKSGRRPVEELDGHDVSRRQILRRRAAAPYRPTARTCRCNRSATGCGIPNWKRNWPAICPRLPRICEPKSPAIARSNRSTIARSCGCLSFRQ